MDSDNDKQTTEVRETNEIQGNTNVTRQTVSTSRALGPAVVLRRVVWYIAGIIIALLALRIIFLLLAANNGNSFVGFIYSLSGFFARPFYGIFSYQPSYGSSIFEVSSVVAIIIYALVAWGIDALLTLTSRRSEV